MAWFGLMQQMKYWKNQLQHCVLVRPETLKEQLTCHKCILSKNGAACSSSYTHFRSTHTSRMKFSGHFLHSFVFHLSLPLSLSLSLTHSHTLMHTLIPSSSFAPSLPLSTSDCSLTHTHSVGCVGGHFMSLRLSLSLCTSFSPSRSLLLSHSSCLKLGF